MKTPWGLIIAGPGIIIGTMLLALLLQQRDQRR